MKNITVIKKVSVGLLALLCIWGAFTATRMVVHSEAVASTGAMSPKKSLFAALEKRRYVSDLYDLVGTDPEQLKQLQVSDLEQMFDQPELKRREGNLTVWQYRSDACVLDIYFRGDDDTPLDYVLRPRNVAYFVGGEDSSVDLSEVDCIDTIISM